MDVILNNPYFQVIVGLVLLVYGGKYLVKGGVSIARKFKISTLVVGVTVIAFGTSAPELLVSLQAAVGGHPEIAVGNVLGSNIANIALVLALTGIILPLPVKKATIRFDWPVMMFACLLFWFFVQNNILQFYEGLTFVLLLTAYLWWSVYNSRKKTKESGEEIPKPEYTILVSVIILVIACIGLAYGADSLVKGASQIARSFGVSERVISITLIAFGTSVPELSTSIIAAVRGETDISVGNIIGSNIFNVFAVLGITSTVKEIPVNAETFGFDTKIMLGICLLLFLFILPIKGKSIFRRYAGVLLFLGYGFYIFMLFAK